MRSVMENKGMGKPPVPMAIISTFPFSGKRQTILRVDLAESESRPAIKHEKPVFNRALSSFIDNTHIDLDPTPPRKARKTTAALQTTIKEETSAASSKPINYGIINLVSDDEDVDPTAAPSCPDPLPNPNLEIKGMEADMEGEEDEDVFNHGGGLDADEPTKSSE